MSAEVQRCGDFSLIFWDGHIPGLVFSRKEQAVEWCLMTMAVSAMLMALATMFVRPGRVRLPQVQVGTLLRGCAATLFLLAALALGAMAWALVSR